VRSANRPWRLGIYVAQLPSGIRIMSFGSVKSVCILDHIGLIIRLTTRFDLCCCSSNKQRTRQQDGSLYAARIDDLGAGDFVKIDFAGSSASPRLHGA
jgi:hypothetical protein